MRAILGAGMAGAALLLGPSGAQAMGGGFLSYEASPYSILEPQTIVPPALEATRPDGPDKVLRREEQRPQQQRPDEKKQ